jgi:hypothetical protein
MRIPRKIYRVIKKRDQVHDVWSIQIKNLVLEHEYIKQIHTDDTQQCHMHMDLTLR